MGHLAERQPPDRFPRMPSCLLLAADNRRHASRGRYRGRVTESPLLAHYLTVIGATCGSDDAAEAKLLRGQFHDVVLRRDVAYRFPRDEESRRLLPARVALLRVLRKSELPVAIPGLLSDSAVALPLGQSFAAFQRVPGQPLPPGSLASGAAAAGAITDLAALLDRLRELGTDAAIRQAVPQADRLWWDRFADDVSRVLFPLMSRGGRAQAQAELDRVREVDPVGDALVHGDLGGANLLWTASGRAPRLAGVLDWDEAHIGNQADDLASIAATFGWPLATQLDAKLPGGHPAAIADAQAIAATFALQQALPAALNGDTPALDDGLISYR